ncbi:hypothetical protein OAX95_00945 [bacterium]|nr:hypothetical protein [bacterium]
MTITTERPPADELPSEGHRDRHRIVYVVTAILAVATIVLGGILLFGDDSGDGASMPSEVEQVLDQFLEAVNADDFEAFEAVVTPEFRRPMYLGNLYGGPPDRNVDGIEYYRNRLDGHPTWDGVQIGDPIVRGDGPWFVSFAETWKATAWKGQLEVISTYALVERDGTILIDDAYRVEIAVPMEP